MSNVSIQNQINDLDFWLKHNPNHPDYCIKHQKKKELIRELMRNQIDKQK